jgi:hypothetical protein
VDATFDRNFSDPSGLFCYLSARELERAVQDSRFLFVIALGFLLWAFPARVLARDGAPLAFWFPFVTSSVRVQSGL